MATDVSDNVQNSNSLEYPMIMSGVEGAHQSSHIAKVTDNGEFDPAQSTPEVFPHRHTGEPSPKDELFSDTISWLFIKEKDELP